MLVLEVMHAYLIRVFNNSWQEFNFMEKHTVDSQYIYEIIT